MTSELVWNAFYIYALLLDHTRRAVSLKLPHHGEQIERVAAALHARNLRMVGVGQAAWAHACDDCEKLVPSEDAHAVGARWSECRERKRY